jgi:hypothetical protein
MEPELWQRVTDLFDEAMTRGPKERIAFLEEACEGDGDLRKQVERLVKSHEKSGDFLESSAFAVAPELLTHDRAGASVGELIVITGSSLSSALAGWARSIWRRTSDSDARLLSNCFQCISRPMITK